ncbi:hypothetical protein ACVGXS_17990, partial [Enterobacter hormaechei]
KMLTAVLLSKSEKRRVGRGRTRAKTTARSGCHVSSPPPFHKFTTQFTQKPKHLQKNKHMLQNQRQNWSVICIYLKKIKQPTTHLP